MPVAEQAFVMPTLEADLVLPSEEEQPDYGSFTEEELYKGFVALFNQVIPPQPQSTEDRPLMGIGSKGHKTLKVDRFGASLDFSDNYMGLLTSFPDADTNVGLLPVVSHTRELVVPVAISVGGVVYPDLGPMPVTFRAAESHLEMTAFGKPDESDVVYEMNMGISYGDNGRFGVTDMRNEASRRHWGIGIEAMKAIDLSEAKTPPPPEELPAED